MLRSNNTEIIKVTINCYVHNKTLMVKYSYKIKSTRTKSCKSIFKWLGPYTRANITCMNEECETLRKKYNIRLLKWYSSDGMSQEVADKKLATNSNQSHKLYCMSEAEESPNRNLESNIYFEWEVTRWNNEEYSGHSNNDYKTDTWDIPLTSSNL